MIDAGHVWEVASAWVDGITAGLNKNSLPIHDVIDRRVRAFSARLSLQRVDPSAVSTAARSGSLLFAASIVGKACSVLVSSAPS